MHTQFKKVAALVCIAAASYSAQIGTAAYAGPLTNEAFQQRIVGNTLVTKRMGMTIRMRFEADGTVSMKAPIGSGAGTWVFSGDQVCTTMTSGPRKGSRCGQLTDLGNGKFKNAQGVTLTLQ
ncbi:MAG: hypothetical protein AAFO98_08770 [Pseudomonadota bacterium]